MAGEDERNPSTPPAGRSASPEPPSLAAIARAFFLVGSTAFGGGASAHIHHVVVHEKGWLDEPRFLEASTVARIVPGTNVSNLAAFVGSVLHGRAGALVAVAAVNVPGIVAVLVLAMAYDRLAASTELARHALHGLAAGAVGIMASLVVKQGKAALAARGGVLVAAAAFLGVGVLELDLLLVLGALLPAALLLDWRRAAP